MLSPEYYESCADAILKLYEQLEDSIISDIIRRIMKTGLVTATAQHQIEQLQEMGLLYGDILALIAQQTDATTQHVKALFEDAGIESVQIDNEIYRENDLTPVDIRQSPAMKQTLEAGYRKTLGNMKNLTLTTAITSQTAYMNACNQAYMQVSSGAFSYQEAIKQAVKKVAETGAMVLYPSGHQERADVAIRRSVLTGIGQTCREIGKMNAEESGCDLMEITAHSGARPEHAKWQGQLVSLSGKNAGRTINGKKVLSLRQVGYGTGDGIFGWNCRHDWFPFFEDYSKPVYSKSDLEKLDEKNIEYNGEMYSEYEISQMQRAKERKVRALKRQCVASQTAFENAPDDITKAELQTDYSENAVKLKSAEKQLREFCKQTGQRNDTFRTQVNEFGRSQAQKAVHADKKAFQKTMIEKGIKNPPKSLAEFEKMRYNNLEEYTMMQSYIKSVDTGMLSPLAGYDKYKEYHKRVESEIIGITTSDGNVVKSQSKHFLERIFGTISDPSHGDVKRSGVELEDVADALKNGKIRKHKNGSLIYTTSKCSVSLNPETGNLIQVTPK